MYIELIKPASTLKSLEPGSSHKLSETLLVAQPAIEIFLFLNLMCFQYYI